MTTRRRCSKSGHHWRIQIRHVFELPNARHFRCVADELTEERMVCTRWRCSAVTAWETVWSQCLQGLSLDAVAWDHLQRHGRLIR